MTIGEYIEKQKRVIELIKQNNFMGLAVADTHQKMLQRIFDDGKNSEGGTIGSYDTTHPLYVNPLTNSPVTFAPAGKHGDVKFLSGKPHKTGFFDSYRDFRAKIGRVVNYVNLRLFGTLESDFANGLRRIDDNHWVAEVKMQESADKIEGNERRFGGKIFSLSEEEEQFFKDSLTAQLVKILSV